LLLAVVNRLHTSGVYHRGLAIGGGARMHGRKPEVVVKVMKPTASPAYGSYSSALIEQFLAVMEVTRA